MSTGRYPMRILLQEHGISGGAETVNIHLVAEFIKLVDRVIWMMPKSRMEFFQKIFPASDRLVYELPDWPEHVRVPHTLQKATSFASRRKALPARSAVQSARRTLLDLWLKRLIRQHRITHCFCNWTFLVDVPRIPIPVGTMVMDLRWKYFPDTFPQVDLKAVEGQFRRWLEKSSIVFPVSETTAADIRKFFPRHAHVMRVIPHGAQIANRNEPDSGDADPSVTPRPVVLYPAAAQGHKNHLTLFRACVELFNKGLDFELVLTGFGTEHFAHHRTSHAGRSNTETAIEQARAFLHENNSLVDGRIKPLGYIDRKQLDALYQKCVAVVLPTFFEGFGLPLIEALQNGARVICSDIPAHREQLTRYGSIEDLALVHPMDHGALADGIEKVLIEDRRSHGKRRVPPPSLTAWTWRDAAEAYLDSLAAVSLEPGHQSRSRRHVMAFGAMANVALPAVDDPGSLPG